MKVKTYKTKSLQEGLEDIKRDLGSEALILSTRSVMRRPRFGIFKKQTWEITAALQEERGVKPAATDPPVPSTAPKPSNAPVVAGFTQRSTAVTAAKPAPAPTRDPRMDELIDEIGELKKSLKNFRNAIPGKSESLNGTVYGELVGQGIDQDLADRLIATASRGNPEPWELRETVRRLLSEEIVIAPAAELHAKTRMVSAFVGPTGVGKTTTIAKIAGHAAIQRQKKVALISTDLFRIGGQEQLTRFGELLGIPTYGCADVATLKDLVASLDDRDLILIDTPGSSPSDLARLSKLESVTSAADAKVHLVISATTRSEDITKIVSRFKRFSPNSVIFTKMDETDATGTIAGDLHRNGLAVSYLTNGQRVPEDLLIPSADLLARYVLPVESAI